MSTKTLYDYSYPTGLAPLPDMDVADWLGPDPEDQEQTMGHYTPSHGGQQEQVRHIHH